MSNLRAIIEAAQHQIDTFRSPDISEADARLDELLVAAELGSIRHDRIERISEHEGILHIHTSWSARGCTNTSDFEFPTAILDAPDPIAAAKEYGHKKRVSEAEYEVTKARNALARAESALSALRSPAEAQL